MSILQIFNATMTSVTGPGTVPDYDRPAAPGVTKFSGAQRVFWKEESERETFASGSGGVASDILVARSLLVDPGLVSVAWEVGDIVIVTLDAGGTATGRVRAFQTTGSADVGWVTRVTFEDA